jgi:hypothetical protein
MRLGGVARGSVCLLSILSTVCVAAQDPWLAQTLEIGKPVSSIIRAGEVHRYQLPAQTGEFLRGSVFQEGISHQVKGLFPDASKIRSFSGARLGAKVFRFVAETPDTNQMELTALGGGQAEGRYTITLEQVQPMAERLFVWKQTFGINNVLVLWNPYATEHPDDYQMRRPEHRLR